MRESKADTERAGLSARVVRQFRQPTGSAGRLAGWIMATRPSNRLRNTRTLDLLDLASCDSVLEIGYGPGIAIELAARQVRTGRVVGIDHSAIMHAQASRRNSRAIAAGIVTLHIGDVDELDARLQRFDKIYSVNVVQFWSDPMRVFATLRQLLNPGGAIATTFMPRIGNSKARQAETKAAALTMLMHELDFRHVETHWLTSDPAPAFCLVAKA
jgi:cyclopropane fatty-acyl-phospholipid synthase-like methyltransferase